MKKSIVFIFLLGLFIGCEKQLQDKIPIPEVTSESESILKTDTSCTVDLIIKHGTISGTVTSTFNSDIELE